MTDMAFGADSLGVGVHAPLPEHGFERGVLLVRKYDREMTAWVSRKLGGVEPGRPGFIQPNLHDFERFNIAPFEASESESNALTQAGWGRMLDRAIGGAAQGWDATHTRIGVGTATAVFATSQVDLQAATGAANRYWATATGVGTTGTGTGTARLTVVATVGTGDGNFAWQEWAIDQGTATGVAASTVPLLNRAVSNQGTKVSGQTWTATAQLDFT